MPVSALSSPPPYLNPPPLPFSAEANQPAPKAPPGSEGHQGGDVTSQLVKGNPGGVGAGFGLGIALDTNS
jgi:hypothetical protein